MTDIADFDLTRVSRWRPAGFEISSQQLPLIGADQAKPIIPSLDLWDCWPLEHVDGSTVVIDGATFWFFLSSLRFPDPGQRHNEARIRLAARRGSDWQDLGEVTREIASPGGREWAGSAVLGDDGLTVTMYFTAAGSREHPDSFQQRLFETSGSLSNGELSDWSEPIEIVASDGAIYDAANERSGVPGAIKAFRDPAYFHDFHLDTDHVVFTGSAGWDRNAFNGVIGCATRIDGNWRLETPLVEAIGVNNELERPHVRRFGDSLYLFFSTQRRTFSPEVEAGPNGLYGFIADRLHGPWVPVNGSGLIACNPSQEPAQAYSWWVTGEGQVISFIDHWGMKGRSFESDPSLLRSQFGGTPAPEFRLTFAGDRVRPVL